MLSDKVWYEIWLTERWDGKKRVMLARVRSKGLAYAVAKMFKEIYYSEDCIEIK